MLLTVMLLISASELNVVRMMIESLARTDGLVSRT